VSTLMRNVDASPIMERPNLIEIKSATVGNRRLFEFNLDVFITRQTTDEEANKKGTGKSKAPAGKETK
jgi:type IV pilus assembly protein PilN